MKLKEIAERIDAYLKKFEADKTINAPGKGSMAISPYYCAGAWVSGSYVSVCYVSFQHTSNLRKADAIKYLERLDAGNVGKHYTALSFNELVKAEETSAPKVDKQETVEESLLRLQPFFAMVGGQVNLYFQPPEGAAEFYEVMDRFIPERKQSEKTV